MHDWNVDKLASPQSVLTPSTTTDVIVGSPLLSGCVSQT
jgi:hypothetical protein